MLIMKEWIIIFPMPFFKLYLGSKSSKYSAPNFTVRRAFTARNTGALPIYINGFDINGKPCQGYGFRVLNCQGFELKPNSSRKIDIA